MFKRFLVFFPSLLLSTGVFGESPQTMPDHCPPLVLDKAVTPSARTCPNLNGVYLTGEFLYWKARQDELFFAAKADIVPTATGTSTTFNEIELEYKYDPGFKLGIGGNLPFDGWDLYLNWTHFHTVPTVARSSDQPNLVDNEDIRFGVVSFVGRKMKQSWNLMFNALEFDWGRRFFLSETLTVRPSFGGKTVWIRQKIREDLEEVESLDFGTLGLDENFRASIKFWGIGPYAAFESKWIFGWGLGLFGKVSGAILWSEFEQKSFFLENNIQGGGPGVSQNSGFLPFKTHRIRPTAQIFIGLDWEWCFIENWLSANLRLGYESQYFWSQIMNAIEGLEESDLTFEGLTFMGRIDF